MFEFSVACKYLIPRRRQLSVSVISLVSISVIAIVVWLVILFFSVTEGLEQSWVHKLTALTAPVRITPTEAYYNSYYHQIDALSDAADYTLKTIHQKHKSPFSDPYNAAIDQEIPEDWPSADRNEQGHLKDLVQLVYQSLEEIHGVDGLQANDFELTPTHIRLNLMRDTSVSHGVNIHATRTASSLSYPAYLGNFDANNKNLKQTFLAVEIEDINNFLSLMDVAINGADHESTEQPLFFASHILQQRLKKFLSLVTIKELKTQSFGWNIPHHLLPDTLNWEICAVFKGDHVIRLMVPQNFEQLPRLYANLETQGLKVKKGRIEKQNGDLVLFFMHQNAQQLSPSVPLTLAEESRFTAQIDETSLDNIKRTDELIFKIALNIQNTLLHGAIRYRGLQIATADIQTANVEKSSLWVDTSISQNAMILPHDQQIGEGIIIPKNFRTVGVLMGDRGSLSYISAGGSVIQEQLIPIYVAGFYDPGIIPIGNKFILGSPELTTLIRSSYSAYNDRSGMTNGINVRFEHLHQADEVKQTLQDLFMRKGINHYWKIETYREYEFTREIMQELRNQKNIFMLIALIIIIVACSNIISMLIILVNDKKKEIGILRSMGASSFSISLIFGAAGTFIGIAGSLIGIFMAILTLHYLNSFLGLISHISGQELINPTLYYSKTLSAELSFYAMTLVFGATICISLLAGIIPAIKACLLRPAHILKTGGD